MKNLFCIIALASLLCSAFARQKKAEKAELEKFRTQAEIEEQNKEVVKRCFEEFNKGNLVLRQEKSRIC